MASKNILEVNDQNFEEVVLKSELPVVVDFWAEWCGPCRALGPVFSKLAQELADKAKFAKLDVDNSPTTASRFKVRGIPTVIVFKNGEVIDTMVGYDGKDRLKSMLEKHLE